MYSENGKQKYQGSRNLQLYANVKLNDDNHVFDHDNSCRRVTLPITTASKAVEYMVGDDSYRLQVYKYRLPCFGRLDVRLITKSSGMFCRFCLADNVNILQYSYVTGRFKHNTVKMFECWWCFATSACGDLSRFPEPVKEDIITVINNDKIAPLELEKHSEKRRVTKFYKLFASTPEPFARRVDKFTDITIITCSPIPL